MLERKVQSLIEEARKQFNDIDNNDIIYHYAPAKYDVLKSRAQQGLPNPEGASPGSDYKYSFSALPAPLSKETINKYRTNGFMAWGSGPIYEYKISVNKNKDAFDGPIQFTSVPEQFKYPKSLDSELKKAGINRKKIMADDNYWEKVKDDFYKVKKKFWDDRDKYLAGLGYAIPASQWSKAPKAAQMRKEFDKWVRYNLKHGRKSQYASYIPHIHTKIKKPIQYEDVTRII